MKPVSGVLGVFFAVFLAGCTLAKVDVEVVSERTALENQVLGTYNALDRELLMTASVRGVDPTGKIRQPPAHSQDHKDVIEAMRIISFHADDIQAFKQLGWAGESIDGLLVPFEQDKQDMPPDLSKFGNRFSSQEFTFVVTEVNQARLLVMKRVIDLNESLTDANLPEIQKIFGKLNIANALLGEKIQKEDGSWNQKQKNGQ